MRSALAAILVAVATPAFAQGNTPAPIREPGPPQQVAPGTPPATVVVPGDVAKGGPAAGTVVARTGTGAATIATDSAAGGNAEQTTRGVPQTGGGGGGGGNGQ